MAFQFFLIPITASAGPTAELNAFLLDHRIIKVDRYWVDQGSSSFWSLCVEYLDGAAADGSSRPAANRGKIDYKETMTPADFAQFAKLRDMRKAISQAESVPVYTIFTNEQLAQMVTTRATTRAALGKIEGIGESRLDKYAGRMLEVLTAAWPKGAADEASGQPVRGDSGPK